MKHNLTAIAIVIGFGLVAASLYVTGNRQLEAESSPQRDSDLAFVYGEKNAKTTIVEFSDFECPFCARVHPTLARIVDESNGTINWEYRHFPLPSHRNAEAAALIGECVGRTLGNDAFWEYSDIVFENQGSLSKEYLTEVAGSLGMKESDVESCIADPEIAEQIALDLAVGRAYGGSGTPFSVILYEDGVVKPVSGALPYENWKQILPQQ